MYAGWCDSPSAMDQMLAFDGMPSFPSTSYPSCVQKVLQNKLLLPLLDKINASGTSYNGRDNGVLQQTNSYCGYPSDSIDADDLGAKHSSSAGPQNCFQNTSDCINSQPTGPSSLAERMLKALSLFKDTSVGVI